MLRTLCPMVAFFPSFALILLYLPYVTDVTLPKPKGAPAMASNVHETMLNIRLSPIVSISEEVRRKAPDFTAATGKEFILFQRGEIDFGTPQYIIDAAKKALDKGFTKYPKSGGEDILKDAIIHKLQSYNKVDGLKRENIVCTYGGQEALELAFRLFYGKKGAGFAPTWSCVLENFVPYTAVDFIEVPLEPDFSVNFEKLDATLRDCAFFYLNSPQNPTGKLFTRDEVEKIVEICRRYGVYLISDEAYEHIVYDGNVHYSPLSFPYEKTIGAFTFSKTYAMTGWRLGYLVTRDPAIAKIFTLADYTQTAGVVTFLQHAGAEALMNTAAGKEFLGKVAAEYQKRRDMLLEGLRAIPGIRVEKPEGAFYLFPNFTELIPSSLKGRDRDLFIFNKLMERGVATVHGSCFGKFFGDNLRFSFSMTPTDKIREGLNRIYEALAGN
jgi:aspartate aminotransferase